MYIFRHEISRRQNEVVRSSPLSYNHYECNSYAHQLIASYKPQVMVPVWKVTLGKVQKKKKYRPPANLCKSTFCL